MYNYQDRTKEKKDSFLVPKRSFSEDTPFQLKDNRPKSILEKQFENFQDKKTSHPIQLMDKRPSFTADSSKAAVLHHNLMGEHKFQIDQVKPGLPELNAAQPHRFSWKDIRDNTNKFDKGGSKSNFLKWTNIFTQAGIERIADIKKRIAISKNSGQKTKEKLQTKLLDRAKGSQNSFKTALANYLSGKNASNKTEFLRQANSFHANVPDYGPHRGVNNPVREAMHLHLVDSKTRKRTAKKRPRSPSPMSRGLIDHLDPSQVSAGIAYTEDGDLITTTGEAVSLSDLRPTKRKKIESFPQKVIKSFDKNAAFGSPYIKSSTKKKKKGKKGKK